MWPRVKITLIVIFDSYLHGTTTRIQLDHCAPCRACGYHVQCDPPLYRPLVAIKVVRTRGSINVITQVGRGTRGAHDASPHRTTVLYLLIFTLSFFLPYSELSTMWSICLKDNLIYETLFGQFYSSQESKRTRGKALQESWKEQLLIPSHLMFWSVGPASTNPS
jgi:hypothetical protein